MKLSCSLGSLFDGTASVEHCLPAGRSAALQPHSVAMYGLVSDPAVAELKTDQTSGASVLPILLDRRSQPNVLSPVMCLQSA